VARADLKADWKAGRINVLTVLFEKAEANGKVCALDKEAVQTALQRYADALKLKPAGNGIS